MQTTMPTGPWPPLAAEGHTQWRVAIRRGNRAFRQGDYVCAIHHYRYACTIADTFFGRAGDADSGVAALVIAHHNLADACENLRLSGQQGCQLCTVHERLCGAMGDPCLDEPWRQAAWRHSRRTYAELARYAGRHPKHRRALAALALDVAGPPSAPPLH